MKFRRHELLRPALSDWDAMLRREPELAELPLVADWAKHAWPVMARRRTANDVPGGVPVALSLPPIHGKRRVALGLAHDAVLVGLAPVLLRDVANAVPVSWSPVVLALLDLGRSLRLDPRVFGGLLWEHLTGLPYLTPTSDIDLLWPVSNARMAGDLVQGLRWCREGSPVRLDGELELPDGAGVHWCEFANAANDPANVVVAKTIDSVELRLISQLFTGGHSPS